MSSFIKLSNIHISYIKSFRFNALKTSKKLTQKLKARKDSFFAFQTTFNRFYSKSVIKKEILDTEQNIEEIKEGTLPLHSVFKIHSIVTSPNYFVPVCEKKNKIKFI